MNPRLPGNRPKPALRAVAMLLAAIMAFNIAPAAQGVGSLDDVCIPRITAPSCGEDEEGVQTSSQACSDCEGPNQVMALGGPAFSATANGMSESIVDDDTDFTLDAAHDVDADGIPDVMDPVNLPSESEVLTTSNDVLSLPEGLPKSGLAILLEPGHNQAYMLAADPNGVAGDVFWPTPIITGEQALNRIETLQGIPARNALAMVLHTDLAIHYFPIAPETPVDLALTWSGGALPADGSWLLVQTDPTRVLRMTLGGSPVEPAARAASRFSPDNFTDYRWQFLNVHSGENFCYDPSTAFDGTECPANAWPGWLRAYSGQAASALAAVQGGLAGGQIPLSTQAPNPLDSPTTLLSPLVDLCSGAEGARAIFVAACVPPCASNSTWADLCVPRVTQTCPGDSVGVQVNENPLTCLAQCEPDENLQIPTCFSTIENCPAGTAGAQLNGWRICIGACPRNLLGGCVPNVPNTDPCPPGTLGANGVSPATCIAACSPGTVIGVCLPNFSTCSYPQVGVTYNGQSTCTGASGPEQESSAPAMMDGSQAEASAESAPLAARDVGTIFDPASKWHVLGSGSHSLPLGVGVDYLIDPQADSSSSRIQQVSDSMFDVVTPGIIPAAVQRPFTFQGAYYSIPATPRDLNSIKIGIEALDGDPTGQTFLIDGERLAGLLDMREGEGLNVTVDANHTAGFEHALRDVNSDGHQDIVMRIPHFSTAWVTLYNANTYSSLRKVVLTSPSTGWITGAEGAVYRYASGQLERYDIPGTTARTSGLHVVSDTEFYVVAGKNVAHYRNVNLGYNGWDVFFEKPTPQYGANPDLSTIWVNPDATVAFAGGGSSIEQTGLWKFANGVWTQQALSTGCATVSALAGFTTLQYVGLSNCYYLDTDQSRANPLLKYDAASGTFVEQNVATEIDGIQQVDATLGIAVNRGYSGTSDPDYGGRLAVFNAATNHWDQVGTGTKARAVTKQPGTNVLWVVGDGPSTTCECGGISSTTNGYWYPATFSWVPLLRGISMADSVSGLAVGEGVLQFREAQPPIAVGTLSATSGDTDTTFTGNGAGSHVQEPDGVLAHEWSWGDGVVTTGEVSTHRYNTPSNPTYTVTHIVRDTKYNSQASHTFTVTVAAEPLTIGTGKSDTFASSSTAEAHHYRIAATGSDRYVQVQLTGLGVSSRAIARLDGIAGPTGAWPQSGSSATSYPSSTLLAGKIPAGQFLDIKVEIFGYGGSGSLSFTLLASTLPTPATPTTTLTAGTYTQLAFSGTAPHNGNRLTRLMVDWGDGQTSYYPSTGYTTAGTTHSPGHTYATPGTRTVTISSQDDVGQVASITRDVTIRLPPQGTATGATAILATQATVNGQLSSLGGASSVTAIYRIFNGGTQVAASGSLAATATGALPSYTATGLSSGVSYTYTITLSNDLASSTTAPMGFQTTSPLTIVPQIVSNSGSVALGTASSLGLKTSALHVNNVAYFVRWDVGGADNRYITSNEIRYPASGYVPWNQEVTASKILPFAGAHSVEIRIEDALLARSNPTTVTMTVSGASPLASFTAASTTTTSAVLTATVGGLGSSPVQLRFGIQDPSTGAWTYNTYADANPGNTVTWTPTLDAAKTYKARIDMHHTVDFQSWTTTPSQWLTVRTNQAPVLQTNTVPWQVNYLDVARFSVTYTDMDGDAPTAQPTMALNGVTYTMHPSSGAVDYRAGFEYHYNVPAANLTQGQTYWPAFQVQDQLSRTSSAQGGGVNVARRELLHFTFQSDAAGGLPNGMAHGGEPLNYWHVVNTQASNMPGRLAVGHHGKALWFGDAGTGTYRDPAEGAPRGTMTIAAVDLGQVMEPALSFSSYYETEDKDTAKDVKRVEVCTSNCAQSSSWSLLHQVSGDEGGYGAWRSQHVDLAQYSGQVVQIRFVFDAIDGADNTHFGWFVDDISVGHDHDNDTLPDVLEDTRRDILIANQPVPVKSEPGNNVTSHVRRLVRPYADSFQLEALVSSANPDDLTVTIGVTPSLEDNEQHSFVLYSGGTDHSSCMTAPDNGVQTFNRSAVVERSDGLDIRIDLVRCAGLFDSIPESVFGEGRNWFLHVDVPADSSRAWIDMLRVVSSGRTDSGLFSTNQDESSDGAKVNFGRDALGHDADQDGVPSLIDPDDTVPSWAPAFRVTSDDYRSHVELSLLDLAVPLASVTVDATYNSTGVKRDLSLTYLAGSTWSFNPGQHNQFPDVIDVHWRDVYGTTGTIRHFMPQPAPETPIYQPIGVDWEATDVMTLEVTQMAFRMNPEARNKPMPSMTLASVAVDPWPEDDESMGTSLKAIVVIAGVVVRTSPAGMAAMAIVAGVIIVVDMFDRNPPSNQHKVKDLSGTKVVIPNAIASASGMSSDIIDSAVKNGVRVDLSGKVSRYIWQVGVAVVEVIEVVVTTDKNSRTAIQAFKWTLPSSVGYGDSLVSAEELILIEKHMEDILDDVYARKEVRTLLTRLLPVACAPTTDFVILATSPGLPSRDQAGLKMPICVTLLLEKVLSLVDNVDTYAFRQDLVDTMIGEATFGFLKHQATNNRFNAPFYWYWDDVEQEAEEPNCSDSAMTGWAHADIRRCNDYDATRLAGQLELGDMKYRTRSSCRNCATIVPSPGGYGRTVTIPDFVSVRELDWDSTGVKEFEDTLSSDGVFVSFQNTARNGFDWKGHAIDAIGDKMADLQHPNPETLDADIRVSYIYSDLVMDTRVDFRHFGT